MSRRSPFRSVLLSGGAVAAALFAAAPASAASWEQISRGNGGQGATYFSNENVPVFASSTGTFGVVQPLPFVAWSRRGPAAPTNRRDVVANTTKAIATPLKTGVSGSERIVGFTADESTMLVRTGPAPGGYDSRYVLRPVAGGPDVVIATSQDYDYSSLDAAISGDGSTVVVADGSGLRVIDTATGAVTQQFPDLFAATFRANSMSDDGRVIAGNTSYGSGGGFTIIDGVYTETTGWAQVSPDGSKVFSVAEDPATGAQLRLDVLRLADGTTRSYPLPSTAAETRLSFLWISPDGNRVALTPNTRNAGVPTRHPFPSAPIGQSWLLTTPTGVWAKFGREFSSSLNAGSTVSRNGKYAVVEYGRGQTDVLGVVASQAALVDLTGNDLPGTTEALSASSYLTVTPPVAFGDDDGTMYAAFGRQAPWLPLPRKGQLTISIDGNEVLRRTFSTQAAEDVQIPYPATAKAVTIHAKVVDYLGRVLTTNQTIPVRSYVDEP